MNSKLTENQQKISSKYSLKLCSYPVALSIFYNNNICLGIISIENQLRADLKLTGKCSLKFCWFPVDFFNCI